MNPRIFSDYPWRNPIRVVNYGSVCSPAMLQHRSPVTASQQPFTKHILHAVCEKLPHPPALNQPLAPASSNQQRKKGDLE
jgi:hypothetical protein